MTETGKNWRIILCERPTSRGKTVLKKLFGRAAGHLYLVLADDDTNVHDEMHAIVMSFVGYNSDHQIILRNVRTGGEKPRIDGGKVIKSKASWMYKLEILETFATMFGLYRAFEWAIDKTPLQEKRSRVQIWFTGKEKDAHKRTGENVVFYGTEQATRQKWKQIRSVANEFNKQNVLYSQLAPKGQYNCQSSLRQVLDDCGIRTDNVRFDLWVSGWDRDLRMRDIVKSTVFRIPGKFDRPRI